ncbi:hypothetical protein GCM10009765_11140 [Fodinicola feengrottensis]|uniref:Uncharacterized protein n=1 Tax=Fodinicola feengrottensis TaxID=435914 RepID=A0ABP4RZD0_9ACTN
MIDVDMEFSSAIPADLAARYDEEARLIEVLVVDGQVWAKGIDIAGVVVVDLTDDRVVANFDVIAPRETWKVGLPIESVSGSSRSGTMRIPSDVIREGSIELPVDIFRSTESQIVQVLFGKPTGDSTLATVALTQSCRAIMESRRLLGFELSLA